MGQRQWGKAEASDCVGQRKGIQMEFKVIDTSTIWKHGSVFIAWIFSIFQK
jgi:hypothetical protein